MVEENDTKDYEFYYADIQVGITVNVSKGDAFGTLTDNQRLALQQIIYLALNTYLYTSALHLSDNQIQKDT